MEQSTNTFISGLDQDTLSTIIKDSSYIDALNVRITTQEGQTTGGLVNIEGNEYVFSIPTLGNVYEAIYVGFYDSIHNNVGSGFTGLQINGIFQQADRNNDNLYGFLTRLADVINIDPQAIAAGVVVAVNTNKTGLIIISRTLSSLTVTGLFNDFIVSTICNGSSTQEIIGWTSIRGEVYLLTASRIIGDTTCSIIKVIIDPANISSTTTSVIYQNIFGLSVNFKINQNAIIGIYENNTTKRIYWTDNNLSPKTINVGDPNIFSIPVSSLSVQPFINMSIPIVKEIIQTGGSLESGIYNIFYRLKSSNQGTLSYFSEVSNDISVVSALDGGDGQLYRGDSQASVTAKVNTNKALKVYIPSLDQKYDTIQFGYVKRTALVSETEVGLCDDLPIVSGINEFRVDTFTISSTIDEFLALNINFNKVKTLSVKNQRLFYGNVKTGFFDINFDARAYRFLPNTNTSYVPVNPSNWILPETDNAINPYNKDYTYSNNSLRYAYLPSSTIYGGQGPNVKYVFTYLPTIADSTIFNQQPAISSIGTQTYTDGNTNQIYYNTNSYSSMRSPYHAGMHRGYKRGEVYRFGIVFWDNNGNQSFVKWIGDIRMPEVCENNGIVSWPLIHNTQYGVWETRQLGIEFTIDLSSLKGQISHAEIVRVDRTEGDRTIHSQGLILPLAVDSNNNFYLPDAASLGATATPNWTTGFSTYTDPGGTNFVQGLSNIANKNCFAITMSSPEHDFRSNPPTYVNGDFLKLNYQAQVTYSVSVPQANGTDNNAYLKYTKLYNSLNITSPNIVPTTKRTLQSGTSLSLGGIGTLANRVLRNESPRGNNSTSRIPYKGSPCGFYTFNGILSFSSFNGFNADYIRPKPFQYGGDDYLSRTNNEYITTHALIQNVDIPSSGPTIIDVYGGDIFVEIYDTQKFIPFNITSPIQKAGVTLAFPVETTINVNIRLGSTIGRTFAYDVHNLNGIGLTGDDILSNTLYDSYYTLKKYIPKPFRFTSIDEFDNRVWGSEQKINGEKVDNWTIFKPANFLDVNGAYGPINALEQFGNQMFFFQNKAFGTISTEERILLQDTTTTELQLGTGKVLQRYDYISSEIGTKHQGSTLKTPHGLLFFDIGHKKLYIYGDGTKPLSDIKGMFSYFNNNLTGNIYNDDNDLTSSGITCTYNKRFNEAWYTFTDINPSIIPGTNIQHYNKFTICYNFIAESFTSFYSFTPVHYITTSSFILSPSTDINQDIYIHDKGIYGNFYGTRYPSTITLLSNKYPFYSKTFDNIGIQLQTTSNGLSTNNFFDTIQITNDYQNSGLITLDPITIKNVKRKERTWLLPVFRSNTNKERIRDKVAKIQLTWDPNTKNNDKFVMHSLNTYFRPSAR